MKFPAFLYVLLILTILFLWFQDGLMLISGESGIIFDSPAVSLRHISNLWYEMGTGVYSINQLMRIPLYSFFSALKYIGFSPVIMQAIYFFTIMITASVGMYLLALESLNLKKKNIKIALYAGIFYLFNPFSLAQIWARGIYPFMSAYALFPFLAYLIIKAIHTKTYIFIILASLSTLLFSDMYSHPTMLLTNWIFISLIYFYYFWTTDKKIVLIKQFVLLLITWVLIHAWWFFPFLENLHSNIFVSTALTDPNQHLQTLLGVSQYFPLSAVIRLVQLYFIDVVWAQTYDNPILMSLSWIIPIVAFVSINHLKKYKHSSFFVLLFLFSLFVVLGANKPTGPIFLYLFENFPFLHAYRNPYEKFGIIYLIAYTPLFAIGLVSITNKIYKQIAILFLVCFVFIYPLWNKTFCGSIVDGVNCWTVVPDYIDETNKYLNSQSGNFRVMMLPLAPHDGLAYNWPAGRYFGAEPTRMLLDREAISSNAPGNRDYYNVLLERFNNFTPNAFGIKDPDISDSQFRSDTFFEELEKLNVRHIVLRNDLLTERMNTISVEDLKKMLDGESRITYEKTFGEYDIYKVDLPKNISTIYSTDANIEFSKLRPSEYEFSISQIEDGQFNLIFLSTYSENWNIVSDDIDVVSHKKKFSYANEFVVETDRNKISGRIIYDPQTNADKARLISFVTVGSLLGFLILKRK